MALGTPHENYDAEVASRFLHNVGEDIVGSATKNLLNRGVLAKVIRDPSKQAPGRLLKISDMYGPFADEFFICQADQHV